MYWADRNGTLQASTLSTDEWHETMRMTSVFLFVVFAPFTIVSNAITLISTWRVPTLCSQTDYIIAGLGFADLLVGVWCIPILLLEQIDETSHLLNEQRWTCVMCHFTPTFTTHCSLHMTALLCANLFVGANFPFYYMKHVDPKRVVYFMVIVYVTEAVFDLVVFTFYMDYFQTEPNLSKRCNKQNCPSWAVGAGLATKQMIFAIPALCMTIQVAYIVFRRASEIQKQKRLYGFFSGGADYKILLILMALFVPLWIPSIVRELLKDQMDTQGYFYKNLDLLSQLLVVTNSQINAPIHVYSKEIYRITYRYILTTPPCEWRRLSDIVKEHSAIRSGCVLSVEARKTMLETDFKLRERQIMTKMRWSDYTGRTSSLGATTTPASSTTTS